MKNAIKVLSLLTLVLFASCKKDDKKTADDGIVGTWNLTVLTCDDGTSTTELDGTTTTTTFTTEGKDFTSKVTFNADGTYDASGSYTAVQVITFDGSSFTQETAISDFLGEGTYEVVGSTMKTEASTGEMGEAEILTLNGSTLELKFLVDQVVSDPSSPITTSTTGTYYYTLEKQ